MIRDLIDVWDALSKDSYVVGRQTTAERHFEEMQRVDCFNIVSYNTLLKRTSTQVASTKLRS